MLSEIYTVVSGGMGVVFFELLGKLAFVAETDPLHYVRYIHICGFQQSFCHFQPTNANVFCRCLSCFAFKISDKMGGI